MAALPALIERRRIWLVELFVPAWVYEICHPETVDVEAIFFDWVGNL